MQGCPEDLAAAAAAHLQGTITAAAECVLQKRMIVHHRAVKWWDKDVRAAIDRRRELYAAILHDTSTSSALDSPACIAYCAARKHVKLLVRQKQRDLWRQQMQRLNEQAGWKYQKHFWNALNWRKVGNCTHTTIAGLKTSQGNLVTSDAHICQVLVEHYRDLGNAERANGAGFDDDFQADIAQQVRAFASESLQQPDNCVLSAPFEMAEIEAAVARLKNHKAGTGDNMRNELLRYGSTPMSKMLKSIFDVMWETETVPDSWREGVIVNLFKKGDPTDPGNYRGITLLSVLGKLYCRVIKNRLNSFLEARGMIHEGQAGFRNARGCVDHLFALSQLVQGRLRENKPTYVFFLDIEKAYDSVWRDGLWWKLWNKGVTGKMWRVIKNMYAKTHSRVLANGCLS